MALSTKTNGPMNSHNQKNTRPFTKRTLACDNNTSSYSGSSLFVTFFLFVCTIFYQFLIFVNMVFVCVSIIYLVFKFNLLIVVYKITQHCVDFRSDYVYSSVVDVLQRCKVNSGHIFRYNVSETQFDDIDVEEIILTLLVLTYLSIVLLICVFLPITRKLYTFFADQVVMSRFTLFIKSFVVLIICLSAYFIIQLSYVALVMLIMSYFKVNQLHNIVDFLDNAIDDVVSLDNWYEFVLHYLDNGCYAIDPSLKSTTQHLGTHILTMLFFVFIILILLIPTISLLYFYYFQSAKERDYGGNVLKDEIESGLMANTLLITYALLMVSLGCLIYFGGKHVIFDETYCDYGCLYGMVPRALANVLNHLTQTNNYYKPYSMDIVPIGYHYENYDTPFFYHNMIIIIGFMFLNITIEVLLYFVNRILTKVVSSINSSYEVFFTFAFSTLFGLMFSRMNVLLLFLTSDLQSLKLAYSIIFHTYNIWYSILVNKETFKIEYVFTITTLCLMFVLVCLIISWYFILVLKLFVLNVIDGFSTILKMFYNIVSIIVSFNMSMIGTIHSFSMFVKVIVFNVTLLMFMLPPFFYYIYLVIRTMAFNLVKFKVAVFVVSNVALVLAGTTVNHYIAYNSTIDPIYYSTFNKYLYGGKKGRRALKPTMRNLGKQPAYVQWGNNSWADFFRNQLGNYVQAYNHAREDNFSSVEGSIVINYQPTTKKISSTVAANFSMKCNIVSDQPCFVETLLWAAASANVGIEGSDFEEKDFMDIITNTLNDEHDYMVKNDGLIKGSVITEVCTKLGLNVLVIRPSSDGRPSLDGLFITNGIVNEEDKMLNLRPHVVMFPHKLDLYSRSNIRFKHTEKGDSTKWREDVAHVCFCDDFKYFKISENTLGHLESKIKGPDEITTKQLYADKANTSVFNNYVNLGLFPSETVVKIDEPPVIADEVENEVIVQDDMAIDTLQSTEVPLAHLVEATTMDIKKLSPLIISDEDDTISMFSHLSTIRDDVGVPSSSSKFHDKILDVCMVFVDLILFASHLMCNTLLNENNSVYFCLDSIIKRVTKCRVMAKKSVKPKRKYPLSISTRFYRTMVKWYYSFILEMHRLRKGIMNQKKKHSIDKTVVMNKSRVAITNVLRFVFIISGNPIFNLILLKFSLKLCIIKALLGFRFMFFESNPWEYSIISYIYRGMIVIIVMSQLIFSKNQVNQHTLQNSKMEIVTERAAVIEYGFYEQFDSSYEQPKVISLYNNNEVHPHAWRFLIFSARFMKTKWVNFYWEMMFEYKYTTTRKADKFLNPFSCDVGIGHSVPWRTNDSFGSGAIIYKNCGPLNPKTAWKVWTRFSGNNDKKPLMFIWDKVIDSNDVSETSNNNFNFPFYEVHESGFVYTWQKSKVVLDGSDYFSYVPIIVATKERQGPIFSEGRSMNMHIHSFRTATSSNDIGGKKVCKVCKCNSNCQEPVGSFEVPPPYVSEVYPTHGLIIEDYLAIMSHLSVQTVESASKQVSMFVTAKPSWNKIPELLPAYCASLLREKTMIQVNCIDNAIIPYQDNSRLIRKVQPNLSYPMIDFDSAAYECPYGGNRQFSQAKLDRMVERASKIKNMTKRQEVIDDFANYYATRIMPKHHILYLISIEMSHSSDYGGRRNFGTPTHVNTREFPYKCTICDLFAPAKFKWKHGICPICSEEITKTKYNDDGPRREASTLSYFNKPDLTDLKYPTYIMPADPKYKPKKQRPNLRINEEFNWKEPGYKLPTRKPKFKPCSRPSQIIGITPARRANCLNLACEGIEEQTIKCRLFAEPESGPKEGMFKKLYDFAVKYDLIGSKQYDLKPMYMMPWDFKIDGWCARELQNCGITQRSGLQWRLRRIEENLRTINNHVWKLDNWIVDHPIDYNNYPRFWLQGMNPRKKRIYLQALIDFRAIPKQNTTTGRDHAILNYPRVEFSFFLKRELQPHTSNHYGNRSALNPRVICNPDSWSQIILGPYLKKCTEQLHHYWNIDTPLTYFGGLSPGQANVWLNKCIIDYETFKPQYQVAIENDFSKFDCTYSSSAFEFVMAVYSHWGMDVSHPLIKHVFDEWMRPKGKFRSGLKISGPVMNASGRSDTALMNALINGLVQIASYAMAEQCVDNLDDLDENQVRRMLKSIKIGVLGDDSLTFYKRFPNMGASVGDRVADFGFEARDMKVHDSPANTIFLAQRPYPVVNSERKTTTIWGPTMRKLHKMGVSVDPQEKPYTWLYQNTLATLVMASHVPYVYETALRQYQLLENHQFLRDENIEGLDSIRYSKHFLVEKTNLQKASLFAPEWVFDIREIDRWLTKIYGVGADHYYNFVEMLGDIENVTTIYNDKIMEAMICQDTGA